MVSIIVPVYNRENVLEECINSVFAQTYQDFEVILIDDGSVDNTLNICNNLIEKDKRVKLITGEHGGVSNARNKGIDAAKGEYIFFLDSDDVIHPLLLEKLTSALESTGAGIGGSAVANIPQQYWSLVVEKCKEDLAVGFIHKTFVESLDAMMKADSPLGCIGGVMMRTDLIAATRFSSDFYIGEDFYFIYENLIKETSAVFLDKRLYYVRLHEKNSSWDWNYSGFLTRLRRREAVWKSEEAYGRQQYANIQKKSAFDCYIRCLSHHKWYDPECKKMRKTLREYMYTLLPAMSFKHKMLCFVSVNVPFSYPAYLKLKKLIRKNS